MTTAVFVAACLLAALLAAFLVVRPLWRGAAPVQEERDALLAIHRRKQAELAAELAEGLIDEEQARMRRAELDAALLSDWAGQEEASVPVPASAPRRRMAVFMAFAVPLLAAVVYVQVGDWRAIDPAPVQADLNKLAQTLAERLESHPDEREGWILLGRAYAGLGRQADAAQAFGRALALEPRDPDVLAQRAQALALQTEPPQWSAEANRLLADALAIDADHAQSLWLAGVAAMAAGDAGTAGRHWRHLLTLIEPDAPVAQSLRQALTQIGQSPDESVAAPAEPATAAGPTVRIGLSKDLASTLPADATVFVVIRDNPQGGMPVAAIRRRVADLPLDLVLTDDMSLVPTRRLSALETLWISARISTSGNAEGAPDDPRTEPVAAHWTAEETVSLVIVGKPTQAGVTP